MVFALKGKGCSAGGQMWKLDEKVLWELFFHFSIALLSDFLMKQATYQLLSVIMFTFSSAFLALM